MNNLYGFNNYGVNNNSFFYGNNSKNTLAKTNSQNLRKIYSVIGLGLCIFFAVLFVSQAIILIMSANSNVVYESWYQIFITDVPLYGVALWVLLFFMSKLQAEKPEKRKFGFGNSVSLFFVSCFFMISGSLIGNFVDQIMQTLFNVDVGNNLDYVADSMPILGEVLFFVIIAPLGEELIFRKLILDRTAKYGAGAAIFFSGITFAVFHGNFSQLFYAFGMGILLAYVYVKTGSYVRCVLLHATVNALFGVIIPHAYDYLGEINETIALYGIAGIESLFYFAGMVLFIVYLATGKVKVEKSQYELSSKASACAFSNAPFIVFVSVMAASMFLVYG